MAGYKVGFDNLTVYAESSKHGNYVLLTFQRGMAGGTLAKTTTTYRLPLNVAETLIRETAEAYREAKEKRSKEE